MVPSLLLFLILAQAPPVPQAPARPVAALSVEEATVLTQGWAFLAQGEVAKAVEKATEAMAASPRSHAALALAIEVEILRGGAGAAVDFYDRWLGARTLEEPGVVRRLAVAVLRHHAADASSPTFRTDALQALAAEGDAWAAAELVRLSDGGSRGTQLALAELGSLAAVQAIGAELAKAPVPSTAAIDALGKSGAPTAVELVRPLAKHARPDVRAAVAGALAKLGARADIPLLKGLLNDPSGYVQFAAAAALVRLGDEAGLALIKSTGATESEESRLAAAEALSHWPGADWLSLARPLLTAKDPAVRANAAGLLATALPGEAGAAITALLTHENPAIRERAYEIWAQLPDTFVSLTAARRQLAGNDRFSRLAAAKIILRQTK